MILYRHNDVVTSTLFADMPVRCPGFGLPAIFSASRAYPPFAVFGHRVQFSFLLITDTEPAWDIDRLYLLGFAEKI